MKRLSAVLCVLLFPLLAHAQFFGPARAVANGTSNPATCNPAGPANVFLNRNATPVLRICVSANTWADVGGGIAGSLGSTDNAVLRADGTGGATAQGSDFTVSDATANVVTLGATATNRLNVAFAGSTSGTATVVAPAVAGTTTVTLPDASSTLPIFGQQVTFTGPTAARSYALPDAAATIARIDAAQSFAGTQTFSGLIKGDAFLDVYGSGTWDGSINASGVVVANGRMVGIAAGFASPGAPVTSISADTAGVWKFGTGTVNETDAWFRYGGTCVVATDQTNATTTPQTAACYETTSGSVAITLKAGRTYNGQCTLFVSDSVAADGAAIDFDASTATATTFRAATKLFSATAAENVYSQTSALATDISGATVTGSSSFEVNFSFKVNVAGTFQPRIFQVAHTTGTLTLYAGSHCTVTDATP